MILEFKNYLKICNFLLIFFIASHSCAVHSTDDSDSALAVMEEAIESSNVRFTPRCMPILQKEFNEVARGLYRDCVSGASISGKTALDRFKQIYPDLSSLTKDVREYIENIHLTQATISKFIEELNGISAKPGVERLIPLIEGRRSLVLAIAHCAFDFNNEDLGLAQRLYSHCSHKLYGTHMITEATVNRDGIILTLNRIPKLVVETECKDHPDFGKLCAITKTFVNDFFKIEPIITKLSTTERLALVGVKADVAEE